MFTRHTSILKQEGDDIDVGACRRTVNCILHTLPVRTFPGIEDLTRVFIKSCLYRRMHRQALQRRLTLYEKSCEVEGRKYKVCVEVKRRSFEWPLLAPRKRDSWEILSNVMERWWRIAFQELPPPNFVPKLGVMHAEVVHVHRGTRKWFCVNREAIGEKVGLPQDWRRTSVFGGGTQNGLMTLGVSLMALGDLSAKRVFPSPGFFPLSIIREGDGTHHCIALIREGSHLKIICESAS